tara:strand:- start:23084 stop:24049 length:966 start_codon:yes stop_codon:yes gene_type:complete
MEQIYLKRCKCGKFGVEHYFNTKTNEIIYVNDNSDLIEKVCKKDRCYYFFNNNCNNNCRRAICSYKHIMDNELPQDGKMSFVLARHTKDDGILGWFNKIDVINDITEFKSEDDRKLCLDYINVIYNSRLYYNIIDELESNPGVNSDYLIKKFNLRELFSKIGLKYMSISCILTYLPEIYKYNNLYYNKPQKRKLENPIEPKTKLSSFEKQIKNPTSLKTKLGFSNFLLSSFEKQIKNPIEPKTKLSSFEKQMRSREKVIFQPDLKKDSDWVEGRSRNIKINCTGVIYYINKLTNEKSWLHPLTKKSNLPGGYKNPEEAGLI